ncbi:MAG: UPF0182 family protein [Caldilineaceae bacterium]
MRNDDPFADLIRSLEENLQRGETSGRQPGDDEEGGGWIPPQRTANPEVPEFNGRRLLWILVPLFILIFFNRIISFYTDWLWYQSLNFSSVFLTRLWSQFGLFAAVAAAFWIFLAVNIIIARRIEPRGFAGTPFEQIAAALRWRLTSILLFIGVLVALIVGGSASANWEEVLLYLNQGSFNLTDPLFNRDISFFIFTLPIWQSLRSMLFGATVFYPAGNRRHLRDWLAGLEQSPSRLDPFECAWGVSVALNCLAISTRCLSARLQHAGRRHRRRLHRCPAQLPVYNILAIITLITAVLLIVTVYLRSAWRAIVVVLGAWVVIAVLAGNIYPSLVQRFQVSPNELNLERPYIADNIEYAALHCDLNDVETINYNVKTADDCRYPGRTGDNSQCTALGLSAAPTNLQPNPGVAPILRIHRYRC